MEANAAQDSVVTLAICSSRGACCHGLHDSIVYGVTNPCRKARDLRWFRPMSLASQFRWIPPTALLAAALAIAGALAPARGFAQTRDDSPHGGSTDAPASEPV